jgi:hypothetical protein
MVAINRLVIIFFIITLFSLFLNITAANPIIYEDDFSTLSDQWEQIDGYWETSNGTACVEGTQTSLIFKDISMDKYILESAFAAEDTKVDNYSQVGFYFYHEDKDNYARIVFTDDNRPDKKDIIKIEDEGTSFINKKNNLEMRGNKTLNFSPDKFKGIKIIRIEKKFWVYYEGNLAYSGEFENSNPEGRIGYNVYASTGYFDNFYLRPITLENASGYIHELSLTFTDSFVRIGSIYTLRLEGIENGNALFSLNKFGTTVNTAVGSEGDNVSIDFENGEEAVNFKVTQVFDAGENSAVWLEDIISAETDDLKLTVEDISLNPSYYQGEDMDVSFSVTNLGSIRYDGVPEITIRTDGDSKTINPRLDLEGGKSETLTSILKAPQQPGSHTLTISVKTEYANVEESMDYQVRVLNPAVTAISSTLEENNGISGTITMDSPYPSDLVDWNTNADIRVYKLVGVGKVETHSIRMLATGKSFDVNIPYNDFYRDDGQYLVTTEVGGMKSTDYFEIIGDDGVYSPSENKIIPTIGSSELYAQLMVLLIGMFAVVSVRNHVHQSHSSIPVNLLLVSCGMAVLVSSFITMNSGMVVIGAILLGLGLLFTFNKGNSFSSLLMRDSHLHDFAGMVTLFFSAAYIALNIPQWSFWIIVSTLIVYSVVLNLYSRVDGSRRKAEDATYRFSGDE